MKMAREIHKEPSGVARKRGRPARPLEDAEARKRLIGSGLAHLTEKGYSGSAVNEILKAAGISKGVFYHYFSSKSDFVDALMEEYDRYFLGKLDACFKDEALAPLDRFNAFAELAAEGMARHEFRRGCLVGNLGQEASVLPEGFDTKLLEILASWQDRVEGCLRLAQSEGQVSNEESAEEWARFFWIGWEGAVLRAKLERSAAPLRAFVDGFLKGITRNTKTA
ncbi:TetR/AcrR family transcriptional regulator [Pelagicoccus mobilis]|uniref:TetR/AcrR family transcriptional regulator n=1 Tax=Pelagicoccus mobilis TaxID=415221 RepID=A0A934VNX4_9BACT|nr:TetR/AcrR family transcriptional regulator [Pelagicoccus mobilis]MBK1876682.1 TetR/AcrR family transcriptional regulator [Pelagicoccus mobilis]